MGINSLDNKVQEINGTAYNGEKYGGKGQRWGIVLNLCINVYWKAGTERTLTKLLACTKTAYT